MYEQLMELKKKADILEVLEINNEVKQFGHIITAEEAKSLVEARNVSLKKAGRVELGQSILREIIRTFADSEYVIANEFVEICDELVRIFYEYKTETRDKLTDTELLNYMNEQFNGVCAGSTEYLENTCLERLAAAIKSGYTGYICNEGFNAYKDLDEEVRWDRDLYEQALKNLF